MFHITFENKAKFNSTTHMNNTNQTYPMVNDTKVVTSHGLLAGYETFIDKNVFSENYQTRFLKDVVNKTITISKPTEAPVPDSTLLYFSLSEILLFSAVISATDTVAALTFVSEENEPKLYSILFGEGVINDAVCIVLYRIIKEFINSGDGNISY
jgi:hypothetical protein